MKTIELTIGQPRVANTGTDTAEYLAICHPSLDVVEIIREEEKDEWIDFGYDIHAEILVHRPRFMWGTLEEVESEIKSYIAEELVEQGLCEENECGVLFAVHSNN